MRIGWFEQKIDGQLAAREAVLVPGLTYVLFASGRRRQIYFCMSAAFPRQPNHRPEVLTIPGAVQ